MRPAHPEPVKTAGAESEKGEVRRPKAKGLTPVMGEWYTPTQFAKQTKNEVGKVWNLDFRQFKTTFFG